MPAKFTAEQYETRVLMILRHAYDYKLLLGYPAARVFNDGTPLPHVLKAMSDDSLLEGRPRFFPGGLGVYVLGERGYAKLQKKKPATQILQGPTVDAAVAPLWFCCGEKVRRYRISQDEQFEFFGDAIPANVAVVVSDELGDAKLFRVIHAVTQSPADAIRKVRQVVDQMSRSPKLSLMLSQKQLGVALLSPTAGSLMALEKAVAKASLADEVSLITGLGPTAETLAAAIKSAKGEK